MSKDEQQRFDSLEKLVLKRNDEIKESNRQLGMALLDIERLKRDKLELEGNRVGNIEIIAKLRQRLNILQ